MKRITLHSVLFLLTLGSLNSQDYRSIFSVHKISINTTKGDTIESNNYTLGIDLQDTIGENLFFSFEILSISELKGIADLLLEDILNQEFRAKLHVKSGLISILNFEDLIFDKKYAYIYGYDCGIESMNKRLLSFINYELGFIRILLEESYLTKNVYIDYAKYGQELFFLFESTDKSNILEYYLENSLKDEFCYNWFDCLESEEISLLNNNIQEVEEDYNNLELKKKRKVSRNDYINSGIKYEKEKSESRLKRYQSHLETCLNNKKQIRQSIGTTTNKFGKRQLVIKRDKLLLTHPFLKKEINIEELYNIVEN